MSTDDAPAWSPDGNRIVYFHFEVDASDTTNTTGLYVLDLARGTRQLLIEGFANNPDWSPDGRRIAFNSGDIFTIGADGGDLQRLTTHGSAYFPAWSPDGERLAYDATVNWPHVSADSAGIWTIAADGRERKHLGLGRNPDWSPDGHRMVYQGPPGATDARGQIWTADTSGAKQVQLTTNAFAGNRSPAWSPNGEWIAWVVLYSGGTFGLWVMDADGSAQRELLREGRGPSVNIEDPDPSWSPDGERLVFNWSTPAQDRVVLWTIGRDGTGLQQLTF